MSHKEFDRETYNQSDEFAKRIAAAFLLSLGRYSFDVPLESQPEFMSKYDFEIRDNKLNRIIGVEAERKLGWNCSGDFPKYWHTMQVSCRKASSKASLFVMVNNSGDTIAVCRMGRVLKSERVTLDTTVTKGEEFFSVPVIQVIFYQHFRVQGYWEEFRVYRK